MGDQILYCRDCGREFVFTIGEQEFYVRHELTNPPGRCADCRPARKQNGLGRGPNPGGQGDDPGRPLYPAICASCGRATRVPFQSRPGGRPVYCNDCFQLQVSGSQRPRGRW